MAVALPPIQAEFGVERAAALPALYADHDRLRRRRHPDGAAFRPLRRDGAGADRRASRSARGFIVGRHRAEPAGFRARARRADRPVRLLGHLRAAGRRHLAVVHAPARHRGRDRARAATTSPARSGRRCCSISSTAPAGAPTYVGIGIFCLATMLPLALLLRAAPPPVQPGAAARSRRALGSDGRSACRPNALTALLCVAGVGLLRGDGDAAGAYRRLLRRPRLRRGARRRDARR